jgi:hypothetical protein
LDRGSESTPIIKETRKVVEGAIHGDIDKTLVNTGLLILYNVGHKGKLTEKNLLAGTS